MVARTSSLAANRPKVCGNPQTIQHGANGIDVDFSRLIAGEMSPGDAGQTVTRAINQATEGALTRGEVQFVVPRMLPTF
jgi:hypothetical protein